MKGWITVHRKIQKHWIWQDPEKFQWWLTMLFEVNYEQGKMKLGNDLITVHRGSSSNSIRTWSRLFGCSPKTASNFFKLLESDGMISKRTMGKGKHSTTLINITHYNDYQDERETQDTTLTPTLDDTLSKRKGNINSHANDAQLNKGTSETKETNKQIPTRAEFIFYAMEIGGAKNLEVDVAKVESRYDYYTENNWIDSKGKKIKSWKKKISSNLNHLTKQKEFEYECDPEEVEAGLI